MPPIELFKSLLQQATASGSRSTVLQPLMLLAALLTTALLAGGYYSLPYWILTIIAIAWCVTIAMCLFFYIFFAVKNPDYLRSERYTLSKMALEKNLIGDDRAGFSEIEEFREAKVVAAPSDKFLEGGE